MDHPIVPKTISNEVLDFCSSISQSDPFFVDVAVEPNSKQLFCFPNVEEKIKQSGGECITGWQIWIMPWIFIEAEFHGIWKSPENEFIDITPKQNNEKSILFLPDPRKKYKGKQVNNIRKPLTNNGLIAHYFLTYDALFAIKNYGEREYQFEIKLVGEEAEIFDWICRWQYSLRRMIVEGLSKSSICPCNSGKRYKRCCGESFENGINELKKRYDF